VGEEVLPKEEMRARIKEFLYAQLAQGHRLPAYLMGVKRF
jgi:hypothetical protein